MRVRWTPEAALELGEIEEYLRRERPELAKSTATKLYAGVQSLRQMPLRGRPGKRHGTLELLMIPLPYLIIYRVKHDVVEVVGFRHTSRDVSAH